MKKILLVMSTLVVMGSGNAYANGAIAINGNPFPYNRYGVSFNHLTMQSAQYRALRECGSNCYVITTFVYGCAAYAEGQVYAGIAQGSGVGRNYDQAARKALQGCWNYGGGTNCAVMIGACNF